MKEPKPIALGAQLISLEIAVVALLQVMGRAQPAAAQLVADTMQNIASLVPEKQFPGVCEKVEQYLEVIEAEMTASNELPPAIASARRKTRELCSEQPTDGSTLSWVTALLAAAL